MGKPTVIINRDDVRSALHPHLFDTWLEDLGIDPEAEDITLCLSSEDTNKKVE